MPTVFVYGVPGDLDEAETLVKDISEALSRLPEMQLTPDHVTVFLIPDLIPARSDVDLVVEVRGLLTPPHKPLRTLDVRRRALGFVRDVLADFAKAHIPNCQLIQVFASTFDPDVEAFAEWRPQ